MEQSFGTRFYLKKSKHFDIGPLPIYLRITVDGVPKELSTRRSCLEEKWNSILGRAKGSGEEAKSLNNYLDTLARKVHDARRKLMESDEPITSIAIKNILTGREDKKRMVLEIFMEHNDRMAELVGKDYTAATMERYATALQHTRSFIYWKYRVKDVPLKRLDFDFVSSFEFWLKTIRSCSHNTSIKYISNFRKIVNGCIRKGWLHRDPFAGFSMAKREVERVALTERELQKMMDRTFDIPRLAQVRDIFVFSCYTGLSYIDVKQLKRSDIGIGIDGHEWIFTKRQKTNNASKVPLLPAALKILEQYKDDPKCVNKGVVLPVLSNQKMNAYLKEIGVLCGISKDLTFHLARHTFATTITLNNGIPIESVSKMLGHKNIHTTQLYAKVMDKKVSEDMLALRGKM